MGSRKSATVFAFALILLPPSLFSACAGDAGAAHAGPPYAETFAVSEAVPDDDACREAVSQDSGPEMEKEMQPVEQGGIRFRQVLCVPTSSRIVDGPFLDSRTLRSQGIFFDGGDAFELGTGFSNPGFLGSGFTFTVNAAGHFVAGPFLEGHVLRQFPMAFYDNHTRAITTLVLLADSDSVELSDFFWSEWSWHEDRTEVIYIPDDFFRVEPSENGFNLWIDVISTDHRLVSEPKEFLVKARIRDGEIIVWQVLPEEFPSSEAYGWFVRGFDFADMP